MQTNLYQITPDDQPALAEIGALLRAGGLIGIPTETVYGLAANALDGQAVAKIFQAKGRPQDNPLIVHIAAFSQLYPLVGEVPTQAIRLARAYWPGPLTMILPKSPAIPEEVSAGLDTVAVRMPSHPLARAIIQAAGVPLARPFRQPFGQPQPHHGTACAGGYGRAHSGGGGWRPLFGGRRIHCCNTRIALPPGFYARAALRRSSCAPYSARWK